MLASDWWVKQIDLPSSPSCDAFLAQVPQEIVLPEPVTQVAAGHHHTLFLTESGNVWACGRNSRGQLGLGSKAGSFATIPQRLEALSGLVAYAHKGVCHLSACTRLLHISCIWCRASTYHACIGASYLSANILSYQAALLAVSCLHIKFAGNSLVFCLAMHTPVSCCFTTNRAEQKYPILWADQLLLTKAFQWQTKLLIELHKACVLLFLNLYILLT